jgi:hypothetical protein
MLYSETIAVCSEIHTKHINTLCGQNVEFLCAFAKLRKASISFFTSVHQSAWNNSAPIGRIFIKFGTCIFFKKLSRNSSFIKSDENNGTSHEDLCTFMIISRLILLRMRNLSDKICRENKNTHFMSHNFFPKIMLFMR